MGLLGVFDGRKRVERGHRDDRKFFFFEILIFDGESVGNDIGGGVILGHLLHKVIEIFRKIFEKFFFDGESVGDVFGWGKILGKTLHKTDSQPVYYIRHC